MSFNPEPPDVRVKFELTGRTPRVSQQKRKRWNLVSGEPRTAAGASLSAQETIGAVL